MNWDEGKYVIAGKHGVAPAIAQCDGCNFPLDPKDGQASGSWQVMVNGTWVAKPQAVVQCCPGQTWPCESCQEDQCRKHKSFAMCEAASLFNPCCFYDLSAGVCSCNKQKTTQCRASSKP